MNRRQLIGSIAAGLTLGLAPGLVAQAGRQKLKRWKVVDSSDGISWILKPGHPEVITGRTLDEAVRPWLIEEPPSTMMYTMHDGSPVWVWTDKWVTHTQEVYGGVRYTLNAMTVRHPDWVERSIKLHQGEGRAWATAEWAAKMRLDAAEPNESYIGTVILVEI